MSEETMRAPTNPNPKICVIHVGEKVLSEFGEFWAETVKVEIKLGKRGLLARLKAIFIRSFFFPFLKHEKRREVKTEQKTVIKPRTDVIPIAVCDSEDIDEWIKFHYAPSSDIEDVTEKVSQYVGEIFYRKPFGMDLNLVLVIADLTPEYVEFSIELLKKMRDYPLKKAFIALACGTVSNEDEITNLFVENEISPILISEEAISNNFYHLFKEIPDFLNDKFENHSQMHAFSFSEFLPSPYDSDYDSGSVLCSWRIRVDPEDDDSVILKTASKAMKAMLTLPSARSVKISNFNPSNLKGRFALVSQKLKGNIDFGNYRSVLAKTFKDVNRFDLLSKRNDNSFFVWAFAVLEGVAFDSLKLSSEFEDMLIEEGVKG